MAKSRMSVVWLGFGAACLVVVIVMLILRAFQPDTSASIATPRPSASVPASGAPATPVPSPSETAAVEPGVPAADALTPEGWIAKPETTDVETFGVAMLKVLVTFDTTKSTYWDFVRYAESWIEESPSEVNQDIKRREQNLESARSILSRWVLPEEQFWNAYAASVTVSSVTVTDVEITPAPTVFPNEFDVSGFVTVRYVSVHGGEEVSEVGRLTARVACVDGDGAATNCYATRWLPRR